jgi:hypothetical protein
MSEATDRLEATLAGMPISAAARLSFPERCGAFYAMHRGFPKSLVAEAFGITPTTAGFLANCLVSKDGTRPRYEDVAQEFTKLGEKKFGERYYTLEIDDRIARIRAGAVTEEDANRRRFGPSATFRACQGFYRIPQIDGNEAIVEIRWIDKEGWTYSECQNHHGPDPDRRYACFDDGYVLYNWTCAKRFRSSNAALVDAYANYAADCPPRDAMFRQDKIILTPEWLAEFKKTQEE